MALAAPCSGTGGLRVDNKLTSTTHKAPLVTAISASSNKLPTLQESPEPSREASPARGRPNRGLSSNELVAGCTSNLATVDSSDPELSGSLSPGFKAEVGPAPPPVNPLGPCPSFAEQKGTKMIWLDRHPTLCRILSWRASDGEAAAAAVAEQQAAQASAEKDTDLSGYLPSWEICRSPLWTQVEGILLQQLQQQEVQHESHLDAHQPHPQPSPFALMRADSASSEPPTPTAAPAPVPVPSLTGASSVRPAPPIPNGMGPLALSLTPSISFSFRSGLSSMRRQSSARKSASLHDPIHSHPSRAASDAPAATPSPLSDAVSAVASAANTIASSLTSCFQTHPSPSPAPRESSDLSSSLSAEQPSSSSSSSSSAAAAAAATPQTASSPSPAAHPLAVAAAKVLRQHAQGTGPHSLITSAVVEELLEVTSSRSLSSIPTQPIKPLNLVLESIDEAITFNRVQGTAVRAATAVAASVALGPDAPREQRRELQGRLRACVAGASIMWFLLNVHSMTDSLTHVDFNANFLVSARTVLDVVGSGPSLMEACKDLLHMGVAVGLGVGNRAAGQH